MKTYKIRNKADGGILEVTEDQLAAYGLEVPNQMAKGGMIKRADGSYSRRGLWDNIRANKGSGKKPTKAMLAQEKKIRAAEKAYGGYMDMGGYMNPYMNYGGYLPMYQDAGKIELNKGYFDPAGIVDYAKSLDPNIFKNYGQAFQSPEFKKSISKIAHPSKSEGFLDYAGNILNTPLSIVSAGVTGKYGPTGNVATDVLLDPLTYMGVNEIKWLGKGAKYLGKEAAELVAKYGPEAAQIIKQYGEKGVQLAKQLGPKAVEVLKKPIVSNVGRSTATRIAAGYQQEKEKDKKIQKIISENEALKEQQSAKTQPTNTTTTEKVPTYSKMVNGKRVPITKEEYDKITKGQKGTPTGKKYTQNQVVETAPSDTVGIYNGMPLIQSNEDFAYGGYMAQGGINNPGFRALPDYVQQNIIDNMGSGGCMQCGGRMEAGGKLPKEVLRARLESHMSPGQAQDYLSTYGMGGYLDEAGDGKWIQKATASIKRRGTEGVCTGSKFGGPGCPPGSKRYNLAKTFRKMAKSKKEEGGYAQGGEYEMTDAEIAKLRSMGYKIKEV